MTGFNEYWKEKAQKIRKSWAAKAKRFADRHAQLEDIRKEVYLPLDFGANFTKSFNLLAGYEFPFLRRRAAGCTQS